MKSLVSIAMATYNGEKYIREQLESILVQTVQDFDVVVCDDCSTDGTLSILKEYSDKFAGRMKIFVNESRIGFKKNFEKAISFCEGEYVALCDQDDIWYDNHLEVLLKNLNGASLSCGNADLVDSENKDVGIKLSELKNMRFIPSDSKKLIFRIILNSGLFQGASMLMPASFAIKCIPSPDIIRYHDLWFSACACMEKGISYTFNSVTRYRQHGENASDIFGLLKRAKAKRRHFQFLRRVKRMYSIYKNKIWWDRFELVSRLEALFNKYGNKDFNRIKTVFEHLEIKQYLTIGDVMFLWHNFSLIKLDKSNKGFFRWAFKLENKRDASKRCFK